MISEVPPNPDHYIIPLYILVCSYIFFFLLVLLLKVKNISQHIVAVGINQHISYYLLFSLGQDETIKVFF